MDALQPSSEESSSPPANAQDDAFDDSYAWVGYESAQPQARVGDDLAARSDAVHLRHEPPAEPDVQR